MKKAFTMIELVFVIVVIGILSMIAIPKFSATRDDATVTRAKSIVSNIRTALNTEQQARTLKGVFTPITDLGGTNNYDVDIFDFFDGNTSGDRVLQYPIKSCKSSTSTGCWMKTGTGTYQYKFPSSFGNGVSVTFKVNNGRFECDYNSDTHHMCSKLER